MDRYTKVLYWVVMGILAVLLSGILYTTAAIYPPFAFILLRDSQEKIILIKKLMVPCIIILACVILVQIQNRKLLVSTLIAVTVTLGFNIVSGIIAGDFFMLFAGVNFNLVPLCFMLVIKDTVKLKPPMLLFYVSAALLTVVYLIFMVTLILRSYVSAIGFMYLSLPIAVISNFTVGLNVLKFKAVTAIYAVNLMFVVYNMIWFIGGNVISVLGIISGAAVIAAIIFAVRDIKKSRMIKKGLAIWNNMWYNI
jgi:hypothetical protein